MSDGAYFVLGTAQIGMSYGAANATGMPDAETARSIIRSAVHGGVTWIDTAAAYGDSEARIGQALGAHSRARTVTKLLSLEHLGEDTDAVGIGHAIDACIAMSVKRLQSDRLDTVLLHRPAQREAMDGLIWRRLKRHRDAGSILALGVSVYTPEELIGALADPDVAHVQMPFNLIDWRWREPAIIRAIKARPDVIVHARSIYLQGLLAAGIRAQWPAIDGIDPHELTEVLRSVSRRLGRNSLADLCLAYVRAQSWIDGAVIGVETLRQLALNLGLFRRAPLSPAECAWVEAAVPRAPETLLNPSVWRSAA